MFRAEMPKLANVSREIVMRFPGHNFDHATKQWLVNFVYKTLKFLTSLVAKYSGGSEIRKAVT